MHRISALGARMLGFAVAVISAVAVATLSSSCYPDSETVFCEGSSVRCPRGYFCSADQKTCIQGKCGDGIVAADEECDYNNVEESDGCDANCTRPRCGNGFTGGNEECDDGNLVEGDECDSNCTRHRCGNGIVANDEECDEGDMNSPAGACLPNCIKAGCGDGFEKTGEECDDGNHIDEDDCLDSCKRNDCGDGYLNAMGPMRRESCDDGNEDDCGTCDSACGKFALAQATGTIVVVNPGIANDGIMDGDIFKLDDGFGTPVVFEFTRDNIVNISGNEEIDIDGKSLVTDIPFIRNEIVNAINAVEDSGRLQISASRSNVNERIVILQHKRFTTSGNRPIVSSCNAPSCIGLVFSGMEGGAAGDCEPGIGCRFNADCLSNNCLMNICQP